MKKIMVVEDESIVRLDIVEMLKAARYDIASAVSNGEKAIEATEKVKPDLIIMDIKMPKLNGLKASKIIGKKYEDIPILILTAYSQSEFVEEAKQPNIVGYIVKPISESQLLPAVEIALAQSDKMKTLKNEIEQSYIEIENRKIIEKAKGHLMTQLKISENEAYQKLRKLSMDNQVGIDIVARKVISQ
ncbi:response regulator [Staphylococcus succinus]|uniref:ANTAR domain-containing response regulator n=1 Tax=Staphylococcus TaxID=1279 RepID=UPI00062BC76C|nr:MULTISPECIES: response regulator [Staphylococcus]MDH9160584.1 response regulator [Staphylococcus succinus]MEB7462916.1 response regulator [Staphylococcus succinus]MEB8123766.1 response regulator [Staphylococcus succinus]OIJ31340.1 response regulator [Staphylococcus sp. LCT-H4]PNZ17539.1 ANTAR domain-containing protein [Staphylococcus succinus subsp. succinus]